MSETNVREIAAIPNTEAVALLEKMLELAKTGDLVAVVAVGVRRNGNLRMFESRGFLQEKLAAASAMQHKLCQEILEP